MKINTTELVVSAVRRSQYPEDNKPEFLLVGRSNVGKKIFIIILIIIFSQFLLYYIFVIHLCQLNFELNFHLVAHLLHPLFLPILHLVLQLV